jgi:transposase
MTKAYRSNLTWEQWELIAGEFPSEKVSGRPRTVALFAVVNAIFYVLCEGCTWRGLPGDFPPWQTVYGYFIYLPKRWVVERTFGWLNWCRRLSKDYERLPETSETFIYIAMIRIMVRRLA